MCIFLGQGEYFDCLRREELANFQHDHRQRELDRGRLVLRVKRFQEPRNADRQHRGVSRRILIDPVRRQARADQGEIPYQSSRIQVCTQLRCRGHDNMCLTVEMISV